MDQDFIHSYPLLFHSLFIILYKFILYFVVFSSFLLFLLLFLLVLQKCIRPLLKLLQVTKELSIELKIEFLSKIYEQFQDRTSYRKMIQQTILKIIPANNTNEKRSAVAVTDDVKNDEEDDNVYTILLKLPSE